MTIALTKSEVTELIGAGLFIFMPVAAFSLCALGHGWLALGALTVGMLALPVAMAIDARLP